MLRINKNTKIPKSIPFENIGLSFEDLISSINTTKNELNTLKSTIWEYKDKLNYSKLWKCQDSVPQPLQLEWEIQ